MLNDLVLVLDTKSFVLTTVVFVLGFIETIYIVIGLNNIHFNSYFK